MSASITRRQIVEIIEEVVAYDKQLNTFFSDKTFKHMKTIKEFLRDEKVDKLVAKLVSVEKIFNIGLLVVEEGQKQFFSESEILLEWEQYKKIPKTSMTYRYDKGKGTPGFDDHIHVYLCNTKNQVYAINRSGTPHDGSRAILSDKETKFLKSIGFTPPANGILEWITLPLDKNYTAYKRQLLFS